MTLADPSSPIGSMGPVVLQGASGGLTFIPASTPLVSLNYYDGRFLRADDLNLERRAQRRHVEFANQAAGNPGPVWGFELSGLRTPSLGLAAGLAIAPTGQVLHLPVGVQADVATLIAGAPGAPPPASSAGSGFAECAPVDVAPTAAVVPGTALYLVCLAAGSGLCGHAEVFGRLCDDGCVPATDRPYVVDGVTVLLRPLTVDLLPYTRAGVTRPELHLRSQVASAYFAEERRTAGNPLTAAGLGAESWGSGAGSAAGEDVVPVGVLGWDGTRITLLDMWTARRERMDTSPRSWWSGRLEQRPWPVFLAQVLQFQTQLATAPAGAPTIPARVLVERGIVTTPAAGYLPVVPAGDVRRQVQDLLGPGVELRLCAVRRDQIPHELERAQHMERISLLRGLTDPAAREQVDVLVPDGVLESTPGERTGIGFAVDLQIGVPGPEPQLRRRAIGDPARLSLSGAGRVQFDRAINARMAVAGAAAAERLPPLVTLLGGLFTAGTEVVTAGGELGGMTFGGSRTPADLISEVAKAVQNAATRLRAEHKPGPATVAKTSGSRVVALLLSLVVVDDPFTLRPGDKTDLEFTLEAFLPVADVPPLAVRLEGSLRRPVSSPIPVEDGEVVLELTALPFLGDVPSSRSVIVTLVVARVEEADGRQVLRLRNAESTIAASVGWEGTPVEADGELTVRSQAQDGEGPAEPPPPEGGEVPLQAPTVRTAATLRALENARIGLPGDAHHDVAVDALTILSGAHLADPGYAEAQARLLFPADQSGTTQVRATTDWVLFRRRRREDCEGTVVPPPEVAPVTAWVLTATSEGEMQEIVAAVLDRDWPDAQWARADLAFSPGTADLLTPADQWRTRYGQLHGGSRIALAGYTGTPGSQAATTGIGRLTAIVGALAPDAELDSGGTKDFVTDPPPDLLVPGTEGSAFLVTYDRDPEPDPDELEVFAVDVRSDEGGVIRTAITGGDDGALQEAAPEVDVLGRGSVASLDLPDVELEAREALVQGEVGPDRLLIAVVWTHEDLTTEVRTALAALADRVIVGLQAQPEWADLTVGTPQVVEFERGTDGAAARLYLLIAPEPQIN